MTEAAQRKAVARPASRLPVSRPVLWTGIALGAFLAAEALLHRLVLPLGLPGFAGAAITAVLIVVLAVAVAELTRRHHRTAAGHAMRYGKRGAVASARHARRHGGTLRTWLVAKAAPRWERREHRPLMFVRLRGEPDSAAGDDPDVEASASATDQSTGGNTTMTKGKLPGIQSNNDRRGWLEPADGWAGDRISPAHRARRAAARTGGSMPAAWGPVIALAADFEPEDDGQLLDWMNGQVTGMGGYGEALVDLYDHCTSVIGIDPAASALLHDVADAVAHAAEAMSAAKQKFVDHYELPREFAGNGGLMTHDGRWVTGEGA
jgi:hypothetical protein